MNPITTSPETTFRTVSVLIREHAQHQPQRTSLLGPARSGATPACVRACKINLRKRPAKELAP